MSSSHAVLPGRMIRTTAPPGSGPPLLLITGRNPLRPRGGLETYVRAHALAAARAGFEVNVFCMAARSRRTETEWGVLHEVATPVRPLASFVAMLHSPLMRRAIVKHVIRVGCRGPVIVHSFGPWSVIGAAVSRVLTDAGIEAVPVASAYTTLAHENRAILTGLTRRSGLFNLARYGTRYLWVKALGNRTERRGYARSRVVLVNYESVRAILVDGFGSEMKIRRITYASDLAFRPVRAARPVPDLITRLRPADAPLLLCVSRHDPRKGVDLLLRALARLSADGVRFRACLVGPGPTLAASRALLARLSLNAHVSITGKVRDVRAYFMHADAFVLPSLEEGSGSLSLLEAMQSGLPIVASRCDGVPEDLILDESGNGRPTSAPAYAALLVEPGNEHALRDALARVLTDRALRSQLGRQSRQIYERRFSASSFVEALGDVYAELGVRPE